MNEAQRLGYLERLTLQLIAGASLLPDSLTARHADFLRRRQNADGGWSGREGPSDLYYTSFALRALTILGQLEGPLAFRARDFLSSRLSTHQSWVDLLALVYGGKLLEAACDASPFDGQGVGWSERIASSLADLRRPDGGYAKSVEGQAGSTYQSFLVAICLELMGCAIDDPEALERFFLGQRQEDGGFLEIRVAKRSGANPTAAAAGGLRVLGHPSQSTFEGICQFLLDLQGDEGGVHANTRIPMPDLLSTFTACTTLWDLGALSELDLSAAQRFVESMERPEGGFAGFAMDPAEDVEYTFYGLGAMALLAAARSESENAG
jgi:geranylgeranyl transferase type-2 subunit beta